MSKLFQIKEDDLATLEQSLPILGDFVAARKGSIRRKTHIRRVQQVLMDVRWHYTPHQKSENQPAGGEG